MDARGTTWGITAGIDPEMTLLPKHLLKPLPMDKQMETLTEASVLPAALLRLPWVPNVYAHQSRHK